MDAFFVAYVIWVSIAALMTALVCFGCGCKFVKSSKKGAKWFWLLLAILSLIVCIAFIYYGTDAAGISVIAVFILFVIALIVSAFRKSWISRKKAWFLQAFFGNNRMKCIFYFSILGYIISDFRFTLKFCTSHADFQDSKDQFLYNIFRKTGDTPEKSFFIESFNIGFFIIFKNKPYNINYLTSYVFWIRNYTSGQAVNVQFAVSGK